MAHVTSVSSRVQDFTGGKSSFEVEARTIRALIRELDERFSGLGEFVDSNMAIAIDGDIHQGALDIPIERGSEVVLIPKISGG